jgi:hydrogenase maturation protease
MADILIYGYGNPGRQDDGLGNSFVEEIDKWIKEEKLTHIETDSNYQLNIEDADVIKDMEYVLFVDASIEDIDDFSLTRVDPSESHIEFTMHAVSTSFILDLCIKLYNKHPKTYLLHLKGYEWEFQEGLTDAAKENLEKALAFIKAKIRKPELLESAVSSAK